MVKNDLDFVLQNSALKTKGYALFVKLTPVLFNIILWIIWNESHLFTYELLKQSVIESRTAELPMKVIYVFYESFVFLSSRSASICVCQNTFRSGQTIWHESSWYSNCHQY